MVHAGPVFISMNILVPITGEEGPLLVHLKGLVSLCLYHKEAGPIFYETGERASQVNVGGLKDSRVVLLYSFLDQ